ncbi:MAG: TetR family transcriptional regulator [Candidatus Dormibacteraeota bacterium]|uniref:TetR family transcriptional regulator n=1 Tax=Candidatus Aeolococcus gillhamiae TaxID=3127015 RepID=A0A934K0B3_9BACT|nr:TetR family transcriptional regulator [Candidatus Dormibacteraeota bacterium]
MHAAQRKPRVAGTGTATSELIYEAIVTLMYERGYHDTSLREVARKVGIQVASVYYHFPSKEAMLMEVMSRTTRDLTRRTEAEVAAAGADPVARLTAAVHAHVTFHAERRKEAFLADTELRSLQPEQRTLVAGWRDRYEAAFSAILQQGFESGRFRRIDQRLALNALLGMCNEVAAWYRPSGRLTLDQIASTYADLFLNGVEMQPVVIGPER